MIIPFKGIENHPSSNIDCSFADKSFVMKILELGGKNYQFAVPRLQCRIQKDKSKYAVGKDKITVSLRKVSESDNWFSLFKTKTIGGDDSD